MKKLISLLLTSLICVAVLSSCADTNNSPLELAKFFDKKGYDVEVHVDDTDLKDFLHRLDIDSNGIYCIVYALPDDYADNEDYDKVGGFIYCKNEDFAKKLEKSLEIHQLENSFFMEAGGIIERDGKLVFIGGRDAWEELQS